MFAKRPPGQPSFFYVIGYYASFGLRTELAREKRIYKALTILCVKQLMITRHKRLTRLPQTAFPSLHRLGLTDCWIIQ